MKYAIINLAIIATTILILVSSCFNENDIKYQRYFADGSELYKIHCQNCHMQDGKGLQALIPPLTDTAFIKENRKKLPCYIAYGLKDSIMVHGKVYNEIMPPEKHLAPIDIAKVLTFISNSYGNKQGIYEVTEVNRNLNICP